MFPLDSQGFSSRPLAMQFLLQEWIKTSESVKKLQGKLLHKSIERLCFYSEILLQASEGSGSKINQVLLELEEAVFKAKSSGIYLQVTEKLQLFFRELFPIFLFSRLDENVLAFLVEHKDRLSAFLGYREMEDLFTSLFPHGPLDLKKTIFDGFTARGFTGVALALMPAIDAIEWEAPCQIVHE